MRACCTLILVTTVAIAMFATVAFATPTRTQIDTDYDGVRNARDNCEMVPNPWQVDTDRDGTGDLCDPDRDGDGVVNIFDNCPLIANQMQSDGNRDGVGDRCDTTSTEIALIE